MPRNLKLSLKVWKKNENRLKLSFCSFHVYGDKGRGQWKLDPSGVCFLSRSGFLH